MDSCMSDVHCLECELISCKESQKRIKHANNKKNSNYCIKNHAKPRWNQEHCEQYTLSFDI